MIFSESSSSSSSFVLGVQSFPLSLLYHTSVHSFIHSFIHIHRRVSESSGTNNSAMKKDDELFRSSTTSRNTNSSRDDEKAKENYHSRRRNEDDEWKIPLPFSFTNNTSQQQRKHSGSSSSSMSSTPLLPVRQRQRQRQPQRPYQDHPTSTRQYEPSSSTAGNKRRLGHSLPAGVTSIRSSNDSSLFPSSVTKRGGSDTLVDVGDINTSMDTAGTTTSRSTTFALSSSAVYNEPKPKGLSGFFFGFMYEEPFEESFEYYNDDHGTTADDDFLEEEHATTSSSTAKGSNWNTLNIALFASYTLTTAATTVPVLLIPTIGKAFMADDEADASGFASRAAASAVLGTACGKFLNGPVGDVLGARRTSVLYSILLSCALLAMAWCDDIPTVTWACFFVEFFQSVQWPCILIILATHYGPQQHFSSSTTDTNNHTMYEGGIYITSIASRFGSLLGIPLFSTFLRHDDESSHQWRWICVLGAWMAMVAASISYLFLVDSPQRVNEPQNPLHPTLLRQLSTTDLRSPITKPRQFLRITARVFYSLAVDNLFPSLRHVLKSGTFWIVALAHTGSSMIRTSERILSTYFHDTSMGYLSQEKASGLSIFASLGTIVGLALCGTFFTSLSQERQRKLFVSRLYMLTIASCYVMALFAIPALTQAMDAPGLVLFFQIFASFCMSLGIAVMFYHIPGLVGTTFGNHKGLFSAYVDGVAYGIASCVWKIVATSVSEDAAGAGWAYGWAAVALLMILCAILMVEFMEHYFVRPSRRHQEEGGAYETIMLA
jgi:MFS family permease